MMKSLICALFFLSCGLSEAKPQTANPSGLTVQSGTDKGLLSGRNGIGFPVPYFTPAPNMSNSVIALDVFPKGSPPNNGYSTGTAWIDVCSEDVNLGGQVECVRVGKTHKGANASGYGSISTYANTNPLSVVRALVLQLNGGMLEIQGDGPAFPGLKRSGSFLSVRAGDDSADFGLSAGRGLFSGQVTTGGYTVDALPSETTPGQYAAKIGDLSYVTDAVSCDRGAVLTGGGSTFCRVAFDGDNWIGQ